MVRLRGLEPSVTCFVIQLRDSIKQISVTAACLLVSADVSRLRATGRRVGNGGYLDFRFWFDRALQGFLQELQHQAVPMVKSFEQR